VYVGPFGRAEALRRGIYDTHIMAGVDTGSAWFWHSRINEQTSGHPQIGRPAASRETAGAPVGNLPNQVPATPGRAAVNQAP
jgi:hypothetical protein